MALLNFLSYPVLAQMQSFWSSIVMTRYLLNKSCLALSSIAQLRPGALRPSTLLPDGKQGWIGGGFQFILILSSCEDNNTCCRGRFSPWNVYFSFSGRTSVSVHWRSMNQSSLHHFGDGDNVSLRLGRGSSNQSPSVWRLNGFTGLVLLVEFYWLSFLTFTLFLSHEASSYLAMAN